MIHHQTVTTQLLVQAVCGTCPFLARSYEYIFRTYIIPNCTEHVLRTSVHRTIMDSARAPDHRLSSRTVERAKSATGTCSNLNHHVRYSLPRFIPKYKRKIFVDLILREQKEITTQNCELKRWN